MSSLWEPSLITPGPHEEFCDFFKRFTLYFMDSRGNDGKHLKESIARHLLRDTREEISDIDLVDTRDTRRLTMIEGREDTPESVIRTGVIPETAYCRSERQSGREDTLDRLLCCTYHIHGLWSLKSGREDGSETTKGIGSRKILSQNPFDIVLFLLLYLFHTALHPFIDLPGCTGSIRRLDRAGLLPSFRDLETRICPPMSDHVVRRSEHTGQ